MKFIIVNIAMDENLKWDAPYRPSTLPKHVPFHCWHQIDRIRISLSGVQCNNFTAGVFWGLSIFTAGFDSIFIIPCKSPVSKHSIARLKVEFISIWLCNKIVPNYVAAIVAYSCKRSASSVNSLSLLVPYISLMLTLMYQINLKSTPDT